MRYQTGEETKQKIINTAFALFGTHGYDATSVDDIMREVGKTKGAFYSHFNSKEDVFMEVLKLRMTIHFDEFEEIFQQRVQSGTFHIRSFIREVLEIGIGTTSTRPHWTGVYLELLAHSRRNPHIQEHIEKFYEAWRKLFIRIVDKGKELGQVKPEIDSRVFAMSLVAMYDGYEIHRHVNPNIQLHQQIQMYDWLFTDKGE